MKSKTTVGGLAAAHGEGPRQAASPAARGGASVAIAATALEVVRAGTAPCDPAAVPARNEAAAAWGFAAASLRALVGAPVAARCTVILWDEVEQDAGSLSTVPPGRSQPLS